MAAVRSAYDGLLYAHRSSFSCYWIVQIMSQNFRQLFFISTALKTLSCNF